MVDKKQRKDRTSISIDRGVLERGRAFCSSVEEDLSFSVLVERALVLYLNDVCYEGDDE